MTGLQTMSRILLSVIGGVALVLVEVSFFSEFRLLRLLDLSLVVLLLVAVRAKTSFVVSLSGAVGFTLDVFSPLSFGGYVLSILGTMGIVMILLREVFTSRSILSSLFLVVLGTLLFHSIILAFGYFTKTFGLHSIGVPLSWQWAQFLTGHVIANLLAGIFGILGSRWILATISKRFLFVSHEKI